jgi:hypothetical protein
MDALSAAAAVLPDLRVEPAGTLRRSGRSEVLSVRARTRLRAQLVRVTN